MANLKKFLQGKEITPRIGKGEFASVYAITDNHVAKVYDWPYPGNRLKDMQEEYQNTLEVYKAGLSISKTRRII